MRGFRGLDRLIKLLTPTPPQARLAGELALTLGCEICPNKKQITVPSIGGLSVNNTELHMPWSLEQSARCDIGPGVASISYDNLPVMSVNQRPCDGPCLYGDDIVRRYDAFTSSASLMDVQFSPPTIVFDKSGAVGRIER